MSDSRSAPTPAPWGGWSSPVTAELLTRGSVGRDAPCRVDGVHYWQESRPRENGRTAVVARYPDGHTLDVLPAPLDTRSKVHEYGGRSWVVADGVLFFVAGDDQRIYALPLPADGQRPAGEPLQPRPLTPADAPLRFGDLCHDPARHRLLAVCETHHRDGREPDNSLVAIATDGASLDPVALPTLVGGGDFYAYPRPSPDGDSLCWLTWDHPRMPWDGTTLWTAGFDDHGRIDPDSTLRVAGGERESLFQPQWSPSGVLHVVSDRSGWWNLYRLDDDDLAPLFPVEAEFATPLWALGMNTYGFLDERHIATLFTQNGSWHLGILDSDNGEMTMVGTPYTWMSALSCSDGEALFIGASPRVTTSVARLDTVDRRVSALAEDEPVIDPAFISEPSPVSFPTGDGDMANGFYYPPASGDFTGPEETPPPLIVMCHGGPTGATQPVLNYKIQYWTSRGFGLLDVNYRGSTGYGRHYREKLNGRWGEADVEDAAAGASYLALEGLADPERLLIRGSSAGGYTVLAALTFTDTFSAGASLYGIGDLETLARDTHKFESRYLDTLVGPWPEQRDKYRRRSPAHHVERLDCPVIFLQGLEDKVVPPQQAETMVEALRGRGLPVAYVVFDDEGHGFRKAANIRTALEAELDFYRRVLGIDSREQLPPVAIDNL